MRGRQLGLTLLETLIAVLFLGVGLISIASLFPVAGTIQRRTYDDVVARQVSDSVNDLVHARGFHVADLIDLSRPLDLLSFEVRPFPAKTLNADTALPAVIRWGLADRCYPTAMSGDGDFNDRSYYWVPLVRRVNNLLDWHIYIFVLKKEQGVIYGDHSGSANPSDPPQVPMVRSIVVAPLSVGGAVGELIGGLLGGNTPGAISTTESNRLVLPNASAYFDIGDKVLDSQGVTHTILDVDATGLTVDGYVSPLVTRLWYSPRPPGGESPTRQILTFGNGVVLK